MTDIVERLRFELRDWRRGNRFDQAHVACATINRAADEIAALRARIAELEARTADVRYMIRQHDDGEFYPGEPSHVLAAIDGTLWPDTLTNRIATNDTP